MELGALFQTIGRAIALIRAAGASFTQTTRGTASAVTRTSAGLYVVTLATATPSASAKCTLTLLGLADATGAVSHTSDTVKTISTFNQAGTATDVDFDFSIESLDA